MTLSPRRVRQGRSRPCANQVKGQSRRTPPQGAVHVRPIAGVSGTHCANGRLRWGKSAAPSSAASSPAERRLKLSPRGEMHRNSRRAGSNLRSPSRRSPRALCLRLNPAARSATMTSMQRAWYLSVAAGVAAAGVWRLVRRIRRHLARRDLGTISEAWLSDPRSYPHSNE